MNYKYASIISSFFSSISIFLLSLLCIVNCFGIDSYTMAFTIKVVIPATICFWLIGYTLGSILDVKSKKMEQQMLNEDEEQTLFANDEAYTIPSMFADAGVQQVQEDSETGT